MTETEYQEAWSQIHSGACTAHALSLGEQQALCSFPGVGPYKCMKAARADRVSDKEHHRGGIWPCNSDGYWINVH